MNISELQSDVSKLYKRPGTQLFLNSEAYTTAKSKDRWVLYIWKSERPLQNLIGQADYTEASLEQLTGFIWDRLTTETAEIVAKMIEELDNE